MVLTSEEFVDLVKNNAKADKIPKGTEFRVYDKKEQYLCTLAVQRTSITYLEIVSLPTDILTNDYTFIEVVD